MWVVFVSAIAGSLTVIDPDNWLFQGVVITIVGGLTLSAVWLVFKGARVALRKLIGGGPTADPSPVFVKSVSTTVADGVASGFTLTVANEGRSRATGVDVAVTIGHDGSEVKQTRTVKVPGEGKADFFMNVAFPAEPKLTVKGVVTHDGRSDRFCYKYMVGGGPQFVPCEDDTRRHFVLDPRVTGSATLRLVAKPDADPET